jgi:hypothetical protein
LNEGECSKTTWLLDVLTALGRPGNQYESLLDLLTYIRQDDNSKAAWEAAARIDGLVLLTLHGVATKAMQLMYNMNKSQRQRVG